MIFFIKILSWTIFTFLAVARPEHHLKIDRVYGTLSSVEVVDGKQNLKLGVGALVPRGTLLQTGASQVVELVSPEGMRWKIAPKTRLRLDFSNDERIWIFQLRKGFLWGAVEKVPEPAPEFRLRVHTRSAVMGVRGTEYLVAESEGVAMVNVLKGKVWWGTRSDFTKGSFVEVRNGQVARIQAGKVQGPFTEARSEAELVKAYHLDGP